MGRLQREKEEKEEFIHVLIKFYAVLEECMPVEENLRKILMMLEELAQQSLQVKLLIYFI